MPIDVMQWLEGLGLEQYAAAFRDNDIDADILIELTAEDLAELGVASIGHRRKLLTAIAALHPRDAPVEPALPAEGSAAVPQAAEPSAVERRQLTIMFCDLVGSTEMTTRLDPEDVRDIIAAYQGRVSEIVVRYGGFIARLMGDGVLAYFGYPQAHEDDAERAVRGGLAIVEAMAELALKLPLQVRIGIATGLVVVGDLIGTGAAQEQNVVGETPNLAARLQTIALPNTVVVADTTRRQLGTLFELQDLGPQVLKGFAGEQRAWRVLGESDVASRFAALRTPETPLIGRDEELDLMVRRWHQAKGGEGRVVLLSADAGVGKSRLTEALIERIAAEQPARLRYFCSPHHQDSTLYPVVGQLERAAGFGRDDSRAERLDKLAALLGPDAGTEDLKILAELLSVAGDNGWVQELSPQRRKELTFQALQRQLETLARQWPVVTVVEDLHWADPTTRELLDRTVAAIETLPVLLIATFRPEYQTQWTGQPHVTLLALSRLGRRDGAALVGELLARAAALPQDTIEEIIDRTDGVPLFLEEVTKVVLESAVAGSLAVPLLRSRVAVPATLQASLMARLDRLGPAAREIAQIGAAIGRDFSYELLLAAAQRGEAELRAGLEPLIAAGLVFQSGIPPAADYRFKHTLVQDTAYDSLLRSARQTLHARIAEALRERFAERIERSPETLANHLTEAGELDDAARYWLEAGGRASGQSASPEAAAHLSRGIAVLSGLPETPERMRLEMALQLALGPALLATRGYRAAESRQPYRRAAELAGLLGDDRARFAATWGLWITTPGGGREEPERQRCLDELAEVADRIGDPDLSLQAHHSAWATWIWSGEFRRSQGHVRQGLALYDIDKHRHHALMYGGHDPGVCGKGQGAVALWVLGHPEQAAQSAREAVALAETLNHVPSMLHAVWFAAAVAHLRGDVAATRDRAARLLSLGAQHGLKQYQAIGGIFRSWVLIQDGDVEEGLVELRAAVATYSASGWTMLAMCRAMLAEAELRAGNVTAASETLVTEENGNSWWRAEYLRLRGDLHRRMSPGDRAAPEEAYRKAIAVAREQQARSLELRAATSLARLWRDGGRAAEACDLLTPVYGWFTEGLDTADPVAANALLNSLG